MRWRMLLIITMFIVLVADATGQTFDLKSTHVRVGDVYIPNPHIKFEFAKWAILSESLEELDRIAEFLKENDSVIVEVRTHTDSRGSKQSSRRLDYKRSESVVAYLINKGVSSNQLIAKGYGDTEPIVTDEQIAQMETNQQKEEAHALNRRVDFKVVEIVND